MRTILCIDRAPLIAPAALQEDGEQAISLAAIEALEKAQEASQASLDSLIEQVDGQSLASSRLEDSIKELKEDVYCINQDQVCWQPMNSSARQWPRWYNATILEMAFGSDPRNRNVALRRSLDKALHMCSDP